MLAKRRPRYFTELELCEVFDITPTAFRKLIKPNIPKEATDDTKPATYHGRTVIEVYCAYRGRQSLRIKGRVNDYLKSTAAERLRSEQYRIMKMRRQHMEKELVSTAKVRESLHRLQKTLTELGNQYKRIGADKPLELLNEAIDRYSVEINDLWETAWEKPKYSKSI